MQNTISSKTTEAVRLQAQVQGKTCLHDSKRGRGLWIWDKLEDWTRSKDLGPRTEHRSTGLGGTT